MHACAPARTDNNYFRNFLAFRATSPSIRKSYKLDCHIHAQIQNTTGRRGRRGPAAWPVKYHLIPREIRFNFARHNIPESLPNVEFPAARMRRIEIFRRHLSPENVSLIRVFRDASEIELYRGCEERDRYRRKNAFLRNTFRSVISFSCRIYSFLFLPPAFSLLIVL